jgi:hypothetical protein
MEEGGGMNGRAEQVWLEESKERGKAWEEMLCVWESGTKIGRAP